MRFRPLHSRRNRMCRYAWLLAALLLAGTAWAAPPQDAPPSPQDSRADGRGDSFDEGTGAIKAAPLPWSQLNPTQRSMLAPLRAQWDQLPSRRQQRMAANAERWQQLPPERQAKIQQRLARWAQMTPEQRREASRGERAFKAMPQADRQRVQDAYQRFQSLRPEQRKMLMQRFRQQREARQGGMRSPGDRASPPQH